MYMQKDSKIYLIGGTILAVLIVGLVLYTSKDVKDGPGKLDEFATCLKDEGAVFYGAWWCSHCNATKKLFGKSAKKLPYVECSTADSNGQNKVCADNKIESYPTWVFKDGSRLSGELTLETLSAKTNCPIIPGGNVTTSIATTTVGVSSVASSTIIIK